MTKTIAAILAFVVVAAACSGNQQMLRERQQAMDRWESMVRWSQYDALVDMIHPDWLEAHPVQPIDVRLLKQFRVTEYRVRQVLSELDGLGVERLVQIRMYHVHSARERTITHREVWRYDEDLDAWLLHSGLPDPRQS